TASSGPIVFGFVVMTSATCVFLGSRDSASTRNTASRSVKIPARWPSSTTISAPMLCFFMSRVAVTIVVLPDAVNGFWFAITSLIERWGMAPPGRSRRNDDVTPFGMISAHLTRSVEAFAGTSYHRRVKLGYSNGREVDDWLQSTTVDHILLNPNVRLDP